MTNPAHVSRRATVTLTFDDALDQHLDHAIPAMNRLGLQGTFYLHVGSNVFTKRHGEWADAAKAGHELGNHSIFHPGLASKSWVTEGNAIDFYTIDRMRLELEVSNRILGMVDQRTIRSFAFPCSNPWLGKPGLPRRTLTRWGLERTRLMGMVDRMKWDFGSALIDYTPVVRELFPASRCGGIPIEQLDGRSREPHRVPAVSGDGASIEFLADCVLRAKQHGAWLVLVFHGIGGGHALSIDRTTFDALLELLARDPDVEVKTFLDAADAREGLRV